MFKMKNKQNREHRCKKQGKVGQTEDVSCQKEIVFP